jgi:molecular chaperone GrpE
MDQNAPESKPTDDHAATVDEEVEAVADEAAVECASPNADTDDGEESPLEAAQRQAEDFREQMLRVAAELENVRKRAARDVESARKFGFERLAQALLPVRDSLEAALAHGDDADAGTLLEGQQATLRLLDAALEQVGVTALDPEGEPFDPEYHEAMTLQPSETAEPNTVLTVIQTGYAINGRLLRPARVVVSRAPD